MFSNDVDLVERTLQGEQDAFESLVRKYQDAVYGLAFHLTGDFTDAQDVAQQAFVTAYLRLSQLKDPVRFVSWLNKITVNESISWLRKRQRVAQLQGQMLYSSNPVPTPHQEYEEKELDAAVRGALTSLSEKNRLAVTLYYIDGLSQREVANFLETSTSAVENRISRARKQLKEEMIKMVEGTFKNNSLPDDFTKRVKGSLDKAHTARGKGDLGAMLAYTEEALDALASVPDSSEARRLRKDALWLKGEASRFSLRFDEALEYHEQAMELEKEEGDKFSYALALTGLAYDYTYAGQHGKATEYRQKALEIFEELGNVAAQAEIWMARGDSALLSDPQEAMEYYQKSLDLCDQVGEEDYGAVCRAALAFLKEMETHQALTKPIMCMSGSDVIEDVANSLIFIRGCHFPHHNMKPGYKWEMAFRASLFCELKADDSILDHKFRVGDERTTEDFTYVAPFNATRTIESDSETVKVNAGIFENCLEVKTVLTSNPEDDDTKRYRELTQGNWGAKQIEQVKQAWFAPGVGPVKFIFDTANGIHLHMELAEYSVKDENGSYFPLAVGNRWVYRWCDMDDRYITKAVYEVAVKKDDGFYADQKGDRFYIDHYAYAYFSGSAEEYAALGEELEGASSRV